MRKRLAYLLRREHFNRNLEQEMLFHLETRAEELEKTGLSRAEALARARREFGPTVRLREDSRSAWQIRWLEDLASDLRYAFRAFRRNPGFAAAAIFSLALGIGANTTMFSLTMEFMFSQPSCRNPETLASMQIGGSSNIEMPKYRFLRDARLFDGLAGSFAGAESNWRFGDDTYDLHVMRVTDNFFKVVGIPVTMGRPIEPKDRDVAVLSYRFWHNRLAARADVLGTVLVIDGRSHTVIGILPRNHRTLVGFGFSPDMYLPVSREGEMVALIARLPEGISRRAAYGRLVSACKELDKVYPQGAGDSWTNRVQVIPVAGVDRLKSLDIAPFAAFFGMLMIVVGLVLLIACANVSSLLLARATTRRQEIAIRMAIGAGRSRVVRQLLAESLLLAALGASAGLLINVWLSGVMNRVQLPVPLPAQLLIQPDWRLLLYSVATVMVSALVAGLMPALKATRGAASAAMKLEERQVGSRWSLRNALVVGQLAVSVVLLTTGFLFVRNMTKSLTMSPGFDADHIIYGFVRLVPERYTSEKQTRVYVAGALNELRSLPGVESASAARTVPFNDQTTRGGELRTDVDNGNIGAEFNYNVVTPDYFKTMGIPILQGREFLPSDGHGAPQVAIINENSARHLFGDRNAVGHTIRWADSSLTIVGLAKNSKYFSLGEENAGAMYVPYLQADQAIEDVHFLIRTHQPPRGMVRGVKTVLGRLDSSAAVEVKPMRDAMGLAFLPSQVGAALLGSMGLLGLGLASIGLFGVMSYSVARRTREIGLRVALGADRGAVLRMVARESFALLAVGLAIGLGIAAFATRPLAMFLVAELSTSDPATFLTVAGVLAAVACAATLGPALRALRVDPITALRYE